MAFYKALKHKVLVHTYGHFLKDFQDEIFYSEIPKLLPSNMTMGILRENLEEYPNALKKLQEYKLVNLHITEES